MTTPLIDTDTLDDWIGRPSRPVILDARARLNDHAAGVALWREAHVPGALHADLAHDLAGSPSRKAGRHPLPGKKEFVTTLRGWGVTPDRAVVVYDDTGGRLAAARAWWLLTWAGHRQAYVLDGGWPAWLAGGFAVESGTSTPSIEASDWRPVFDDSMVATTADVVRGGALLLDARAAERFRGEHEPIDARAGHIPGAANLPGTDLLDARQYFVDGGELAAALPADDRIIAYCGSGVSACQLILACAQIGRPLPRLYPGSWSAWSGDPSRPVATGPAMPDSH